MIDSSSACILNNGFGAWAFEELANQLADTLWVEVSPFPRQYNYLLHVEDYEISQCQRLFIPFRSIELASDKRLLAEVFSKNQVPPPKTFLVETLQEIQTIIQSHPDKEWCLKYPLGCGASGHRLLTGDTPLPQNWPTPYIVQEFLRQDYPEVYRTYGTGGEVFGWIVRRFPSGGKTSPWVSHAQGARYETVGEPPPQALQAAQTALQATDLLDSFGCVDLMCRPSGEWVVLEVGTDGIFNHVDRDLGKQNLEREIQSRIAEAFWDKVGLRPWGNKEWSPKTENK